MTATARPTGVDFYDLSDALSAFDDYDFYPLDAPGMPRPGPDFIEHAIALGDPIPPQKGKAKDAPLALPPLSHLERLYRAALYGSHFTLPIKVKGQVKSARFVPGHQWGSHFPVGGPHRVGRVDVMVLGKCLGGDEERFARNFAGKTSQQFATWLLEGGWREEDFDRWYVTNLVRHVPLDVAKKATIAKGWIKNCAPLVEQELRLLRPRFVLCLGTEAAAWMLGEEAAGGVSASHGRILTRRVPIHRHGEPEAYHEVVYMTCLHPAAVSHTPDKLPDLRKTLERFKQLVDGQLQSEGSQEIVDHRAVWTDLELRQVVDDVLADHAASGRAAQAISLDCEWHGEYWSDCHRVRKGEIVLPGKKSVRYTVPEEKGEPLAWLRTIQFSHKPGFGRAVVLRHGGRRHPQGDDRVGTPAFVPSIAAAVVQLKRLFTPTPGRAVRAVGHNLKADLPWLFQLDEELGNLVLAAFEPAPTPERCRDEGGFDTMYALHAFQETAEKKLEVALMNLCGVRRYDGDVQKERKAICAALKISDSALPGYGEIADEVLHPYSNWDVDGDIRLFEAMTRPGGFLDSDQFGLNSWTPFWLSQGKLSAELEMEMTGLLVDYGRAEKLMAVYVQARSLMLEQLRELIGWPTFNPNSVFQVRTVLFGPHLSGKRNKDNGAVEDPRPPEVADTAIVLGLNPVKSTGKPAKDWEKLVQRNQERDFDPCCDKEVLGVLLARALAAGDQQAADILRTLRWTKFLNHVLQNVFCPPKGDAPLAVNEAGDVEFEKGFMAAVELDRRVRTRFTPVDTGRVASRDPNCQNLSKRREKDLKDICESLKEKTGGVSLYKHPLRSIITCEPDELVVDADLTGAELLMMAVQSGSAKMVDHCQRASLPESDPNHYDIHSNVAKAAFKFDGPPLKGWMSANNRGHLRDIAKTIAFGLPYGRGDAAVVRAVEELGIKVTLDDVAAIRDVLFGNYPELEGFFAACRARVLNPGHMTTCFGRRRRFQVSDQEGSSLADMERVAGNFPIQGGIADATSTAIRLARHYPHRRDADGVLKYKLALQVHDALMSVVRIPHLGEYIDKVLPACMIEGITVYAVDLDGNRLPNRPGYKLGFDWSIQTHWGEKLSYERGLELGVDPKYLPKPKKAS